MRAPGASGRPPIGRADAVDAVRRALDTGAGVVVTSGPGAGRTSLLRHVAELTARTALPERPLHVLYADRSTRSIRLGALVPILGADPTSDDIDTTLGSEAALVVRALEQLSAGTAPVVLVEDVGYLDDASAVVLARAADAGATVLAGLGRGARLPDALAASLRDGTLVVQDLEPLDDAAMARLAADVLGGPVEPVAVRELTRAVGGAPAAAVDVLHHAVADGVLQRVGRVWRLTSSLTVPEVTVHRAAAVTGDLGPEPLDLLDLLTIAGAIPLGDLLRVRPDGDVATLEDRRLVAVEDRAGRRVMTISDPLVRTARVAIMGRARATLLATELLDALDPAEADPLLLARLRHAAGSTGEVTETLVAARAARAAGDVPFAAALCRTAMDRTPDVPTAVFLAELLISVGRTDEAERLLAGLHPDDDAERALVAMTRAVGLAHRQGRVDEALAVLGAARANLATSDWVAEIRGLEGVITLLLGRPDAALEIVADDLEPRSGRAFVQAVTAAGPALVVTGRHLDAADLADAAFHERLALGDQPMLSEAGLHALVRSMALAEAGEFADAAVIQEFVSDHVTAIGDRDGLMWVGIMSGRRLLDQGRLRAARLAFETAASAATDLNLVAHLRWARAGVVLATAQLGDPDRTRRALDALDACPPTPLALMAPDVERARAWASITRGDVRTGADVLLAAARMAADSGQSGLELIALHDLIRLSRVEHVDRLVSVGAAVQGPLAMARVRHGLTLASGDAHGLSEAADTFEQLGASVFAAETANQASWAHRRAGDRSRAERERARMLRLRAVADGVSTPALHLHPGLAWLTDREREVAALAAAAVPSKEIARRLGVSVRTVDNLLQRVYRKLGIRGRDALRETATTTTS